MERNIDPALLFDNADKSEEFEYFSPFSDEQLAKYKTEIAETSLLISEIEEEKKTATQEYNDRLRIPKAELKNLHTNYKQKGALVKERCYLFIDPHENVVCYYNALGQLVHHRKCKPDERQTSLQLHKRTGTTD